MATMVMITMIIITIVIIITTPQGYAFYLILLDKVLEPLKAFQSRKSASRGVTKSSNVARAQPIWL